jgi:hypothetical protein
MDNPEKPSHKTKTKKTQHNMRWTQLYANKHNTLELNKCKNLTNIKILYNLTILLLIRHADVDISVMTKTSSYQTIQNARGIFPKYERRL